MGELRDITPTVVFEYRVDKFAYDVDDLVVRRREPPLGTFIVAKFRNAGDVALLNLLPMSIFDPLPFLDTNTTPFAILSVRQSSHGL